MTESHLPFVSVVVPVRNGEDHIGDCLASLSGVDYPPERREILVVDNASGDRTPDIVARFPVRHLREGRVGPSSARNRGILESRGEIVAFLDADCLATRGWLRHLVEPFLDPEVSGSAGEIFAFPPRTAAERYMAGYLPRWQRPALESTRWPFAVTANLAFRRETFERVGLFDTLLPRGQDRDFGRRVLEAGLGIAYAANAIALHRHRPTTRGLFHQQMGWGYGAVLLHSKYGLPWGMREEVAAHGRLSPALGNLLTVTARRVLRRAGRRELADAWFESVRRIARRLGVLQGLLRQARRRDRSGAKDVVKMTAGSGAT